MLYKQRKLFFFSQQRSLSLSLHCIMSLLQVIAKDANKQLENLSSFYLNYILPYVERRTSYTTIAAAVVLYFSYRVHKMSEIPENLRHIPAVPYWPFMRSLLSGESIDHRARKYILPVIANSPNGLYLRPVRNRWAVSVAGPAAMKSLLLRSGRMPPFQMEYHQLGTVSVTEACLTV
jgi:hypothetical protein